MEKDLDFRFYHQYLDVQYPVLNSLGAQLDIQQQNVFSAHLIPRYNGISTSGNFPSPFTAPMQFKAHQPSEPNNWFNGLPRFNPFLKSATKERDLHPNTATGNSQRKFLVFDQSGDQTKLLYSSVNNAPAPGLPLWLQKPSTAYDSNKDQKGHFLGGECVEENRRGSEESEMHEDTEELNALLYSDDDEDNSDGDYSEDDEEISTGHSPSTVTDHIKQEVASSDEPRKRQKLSDGGYDVSLPSKPFGPTELDDDAESSCGNNNHRVSGKKRLRKEKIRETLSILQKIVPCGKGKDPMDVIDGAIRYLKSLKVEAKSLRLDPL